MRQTVKRSRVTDMALLVLLAVAIDGLAGCATSTTVTSNKSTITVVQHTQSFTIAPGQTTAGTASCASGEALLSGGYLIVGSMPQGHFGVVDSYPSDSSGNPPASQGTVEDSWTVRVHNTSASQKTYLVSANCASGYPITTAVWSAPIQIKDGIGAGGVAQCPSFPTNVLVGGGYSYSPNGDVPIAWLGPAYGNGSDQTWDVITIGVQAAGTAFAVCAKGVFDEPLVTQQNYANYLPPANPLNPSGSVACPEGEVLAGGGFGENDIDFWNTPVTINSMSLGDSSGWQVALDSDGSTGAVPPDYTFGICVALKWGGRVSITFSNYHHLIRIPADIIIVATDGSGQVKATPTTVRVTHVASNPIAAIRSINPFTGGVSFVVPPGCGSPTPATDAATSALKDKLKGALPSGQVAFGSPTVTINRGSLTCSPVAGTQRSAPFTYTQMIDGSATQASYNPHDIVKYQYSQLQQATQQSGSPYVLRDTLICPEGPKLVSATSTRATVQCPAYGVAEWPFSADQLQALAQKLAGKSKSDAMAILDGTQGIEPGSEAFSHLQGDTLPSKAADITIIIVRPQDTAPVFRAP